MPEYSPRMPKSRPIRHIFAVVVANRYHPPSGLDITLSLLRERRLFRRLSVGEAMPARLRPRLEPTDDWQQLQLLSRFPEQLTDELIRPVVLFGHSPAERAQQTGAAARTLSRQAARFTKDGMASLFAPQVER